MVGVRQTQDLNSLNSLLETHSLEQIRHGVHPFLFCGHAGISSVYVFNGSRRPFRESPMPIGG